LIANTDSIEPAAPKVCPIELLFAVTITFFLASESFKRLWIALASHKSPAGVDVA
jgi:hypothetical protein